jgi:hypothetical protein
MPTHEGRPRGDREPLVDGLDICRDERLHLGAELRGHLDQDRADDGAPTPPVDARRIVASVVVSGAGEII